MTKPLQPTWVSRLVVEAIHFDQMLSHGGMPGIRDDGALEGALAWPQQRLAYEPDSDLCALAAAYGYGLARNHPFNDGNKRVSFVVMAVFLALNGVDLCAAEASVVAVMLELAAGTLAETDLAEWLRLNAYPRPTDRC